MHIVFVCAEFPTRGRATGGIGTYTDAISRALVACGAQVTILCQGEKRETKVENKRKIISLPVVRISSSLLQIPLIQRLISFANYPLFFSFEVARVLGKLSKKQPIDIIEGGDFGAELFFYLLLRRDKHIPVIIKLHTPSFLIRAYNGESETLFYRLMETAELFSLTHAEALYSPTRDLAEAVQKKLNRPVNTVVPYPLPALSIVDKVNRRPFSFLYVGKLQRKKGVFVLMEAFTKVLQKIPQATLFLVGPDTRENGMSIKKMLLQRIHTSVRKQVTFLNPVPRKTLFLFYKKTMVTVVPSLWENYPNVILESLTNGARVVATNTGGIPEMLDPTPIPLVPPGNSSALAEMMMDAVRNHACWYTYTRRAASHVKSALSADKIAHATMAFYVRCQEEMQEGSLVR